MDRVRRDRGSGPGRVVEGAVKVVQCPVDGSIMHQYGYDQEVWRCPKCGKIVVVKSDGK